MYKISRCIWNIFCDSASSVLINILILSYWHKVCCPFPSHCHIDKLFYCFRKINLCVSFMYFRDWLHQVAKYIFLCLTPHSILLSICLLSWYISIILSVNQSVILCWQFCFSPLVDVRIFYRVLFTSFGSTCFEHVLEYNMIYLLSQ